MSNLPWLLVAGYPIVLSGAAAKSAWLVFGSFIVFFIAAFGLLGTVLPFYVALGAAYLVVNLYITLTIGHPELT